MATNLNNLTDVQLEQLIKQLRQDGQDKLATKVVRHLAQRQKVNKQKMDDASSVLEGLVCVPVLLTTLYFAVSIPCSIVGSVYTSITTPDTFTKVTTEESAPKYSYERNDIGKKIERSFHKHVYGE